jgi:hypothetical protein
MRVIASTMRGSGAERAIARGASKAKPRPTEGRPAGCCASERSERGTATRLAPHLTGHRCRSRAVALAVILGSLGAVDLASSSSRPRRPSDRGPRLGDVLSYRHATSDPDSGRCEVAMPNRSPGATAPKRRLPLAAPAALAHQRPALPRDEGAAPQSRRQVRAHGAPERPACSSRCRHPGCSVRAGRTRERACALELPHCVSARSAWRMSASSMRRWRMSPCASRAHERRAHERAGSMSAH